jgi:WhiB family redox-sensing transcriptional regulator
VVFPKTNPVSGLEALGIALTMMALIEARSRREFAGALPWTLFAACKGQTDLFFPRRGERPERRDTRESAARKICDSCPALEPCREWARRNREYGFWGGESEVERAAAGYRPAIAGGGTEWNESELDRKAV